MKVRLGRLTSKGQKGVDSRIVRDLIVLANQRAITTAYLLSSDEDLREGVTEAQDRGLRVVLLGSPETPKSRQSFALAAEADEHVVLPESFWRPLFLLASGYETPTPISRTDPQGPMRPSPRVSVVEATAMSVDVDERQVRTAARQFAETWRSTAGHGAVDEVVRSRPQIPRDLDARLLMAVETSLGRPLRGIDFARRAARSEFWRTIA